MASAQSTASISGTARRAVRPLSVSVKRSASRGSNTGQALTGLAARLGWARGCAPARGRRLNGGGGALVRKALRGGMGGGAVGRGGPGPAAGDLRLLGDSHHVERAPDEEQADQQQRRAHQGGGLVAD